MARILVATGDGRGKTTAGLGTAIRAWGSGLAVVVYQFLKARSSGELRALQQLGIPVRRSGLGFVPQASDARFGEHRACAVQLLDHARRALQEREARFFLLDELCTAYSRGLLAEHELLELGAMADDEAVLFFTGRGAPPALVALADTVTVCNMVSHAMTEGRPAQRGVEF